MAEEALKQPVLVRDGDLVAIRDRDGSVSMVHRDDLAAAQSEGAVPATETEWANAKLGKAGELATAAIGAGQAGTFGFGVPAMVGAAEALGANDTAEDIKRAVKIAKETSPNAYLAGELGGALLPGPGGVGKVAKLAEGGLARAGQRVLQAAPHAIGTGVAIGLGEQATEDTLEDREFAVSAYLSSAAKGGAIGLLLGGALSAGGGAVGDHLAPLFGRRGTAAVERAGDDVALAAEDVATKQPGRVTIDPDAGLYEKAGAVEKPFSIGGKRHGVTINSDALENEFASYSMSQPPIRRTAHADPNAPLRGPVALEDLFTERAGLDAAESVFNIRSPKLNELFTDAERPVFGRTPLAERVGVGEAERAPIGVRLSVDPNAGLAAEEEMGRRVFGVTRSKSAPREVRVGDVGPQGLPPVAEKAPLRIGAPTEAAIEEVAAREGKRGAEAWLDQQADIQAFKSTGAKVHDTRRLGRTVEEQQAAMERIGGRLRNETVEGKPLVEALASQDEIAKRITQRADEVGKELAEMRAGLDKATARPDMGAIVERFQNDVAREFEAMPLGERDLVAAREYLQGMVEKGGERPSFDQLHKYRRHLDEKLAKEYNAPPGMPVPPGREALMRLRDIVESEFERAGELASKEIGGSFGSKYKLTKELYADLATARKIAKADAERNAGANFVSITDVILGAAGGPKGLALAAANQVRRKFGNQIASHVLGKASKLFAVEDAAAKMDSALSKATKSFVEGAEPKVRGARQITADEVRQIRDVVRSPETVQARIAQALGDMPKYAPKTAAAVATRMSTVAALLRDTLPKEPAPTMLTFGPPKTQPISDTELLRASQVVETIEDPSVVVDRLLEGRLSRVHVETLKAAHPEVYAKIQTYLQTHGAELRRELPVQQQVTLSLFFGQPVTAAMLPENIRAFQATFVGGSQAPAQDMSAGGAGLPVRGLKDTGKVGTALDQLERGEA